MGGGNFEDISTHSVRSDAPTTTPEADARVQIESMVAIDHPSSDELTTQEPEDRKYMLLYSKSKVYIHPTAYARDNIPGFVAIVRKDAVKPEYYIAWIPESLLEERGQEEWDKFHKVENSTPSEEEDVVLVDLPEKHGESYAFSVPISSIYSLLVYPPSFSSWYGSVAVHLAAGETLPTLYFHDDESRSFTNSSPGSPRLHSTWGGEELLQRLRSYANLLRSSLQSSLFLVNPSRADIETHTMILYADDAVDEILNPSTSTPRHRRRSPASGNGHSRRTSVLHQTLAPPSPSSQARLALLQGFSQITKGARTTAQRILSHPLAKPIVPHLPDPVKSLVNANGEWASWVEKGGMGEFESARVYLARWARIVAEEGERARQREVRSMSPGSGEDEEDGGLGVFEILKQSANLPTPKSTRDPKKPIDKETWSNWFAGDGRPLVTREYMRQEVFRRGLGPGVRKKAWPFILDVLPWDADEREREIIWSQRKIQYRDLKAEWYGVEEVFDREDIIEERHRIDVDCRRTDRTQPLFLADSPTSDNTPGSSQPAHRSKFSPSTDDVGAQSQTNEHVEKLCEILLTYDLYEKNLGYVQGMSDLCAPIYVVTGADEVMTFWCFVSVMERMKQNFLRDQSGMKKQLGTLQQLLAVMDPALYRHLEKTDSLNLFFCFRWVLISFKREFPFDDVLRLWELLWTNYYSQSFVLFVALAVMESHRDVIMRYLVEFDEILKYCNELSMTIELDTTLAQAEVLFLSFQQIVADIDRRVAEQSAEGSSIRRRAGKGIGDDRKDISISKLPIISEDLRALLVPGK